MNPKVHYLTKDPAPVPDLEPDESILVQPF